MAARIRRQDGEFCSVAAHMMKQLTAAMGLAFLAATPLLRCEPPDAGASSVIGRFLEWQERQEARLTWYRSTRRYTLNAVEQNKFSELEVEVTFDQAKGESFKVLHSAGAAGVYRFALQKALDNEAILMKPQNRLHRLLTLENYRFEVIGKELCGERACYAVTIEPRRKISSLLEGRVWIDAQDFGLVKIDARVASVSFWAGQPHIVQEFRRTDGFWMLQQSDFRTKARGFGETALRIEILSQSLPAAAPSVAKFFSTIR